ncbi:TatD family hydrolase [Thermus composti]|uniref:TatD family hydrolase n=1 Tax=Thermus composti TaxID=532059 RepID=A0ABV6Q1Z5_9DEIN|nr:TatD family hydrolase [Thermus composti]GGM95042.1 TatD family hydrolase [Thermus composti]
MTDTHAHLDFLEPEELEEAQRHLGELRAVLTLGVDPSRWEKTLNLAQGNVYAAVGLHPTSAHLLSPEVMEALRHYAQKERVRAIGETGLDYYWTPETKAAQLKALDFQAALAEELDLPLVLHVRSRDGKAEEDLAGWLLLHRPKRVVLHAFSGHPALEEAGLKVGAYFSFAGPLTYKKNEALREAAKRLPEERLLVETDTPFLPPEPHRGRRNRPHHVRFTLEKLAEVRGLSFAEAEALTDWNAAACFRWLDPGGTNP